MSAFSVYEGTIRHRRFAERGHEFSHRIAMAYIDVSEAGGLLRRRDYLGDPAVPLVDAVRSLVVERAGVACDGPVRLLTFPRRFGKSFSPVSFYYCFAGSGRLEAIVAEVTSTPWAQRHAYVLTREGDGQVLTGGFSKQLHVSPFMGMDQHYAWRAAAPGETLSVHIESTEGGERAFDATLSLRLALDSARATSPARVLALIYGHAMALKLKGVPVHSRPEVAA